MADIFLSYANEDRETAGQLAHVLETAGFSVWWDRRIPAGRTWRTVLEEALQGMRCLIVLWSENSLKSPWVIEEAEEARRLEKMLFPVLIQQIEPPVGFRAIQAANLVDWDGSADAPALELLVTDLKSLLGETKVKSSDKGVGDRPADSANRDSSSLSQLRKLFARHWAVGVVGGAVIALVLIALQISWPPDRDAPDLPRGKPVSEPSPGQAPVRQLTALAVAGAPQELNPSETVALTVRGHFSDGTTNDLAGSIIWTSSDSRVAAVDGHGNVRALKSGTAEISAHRGDLVSPPWTVQVKSAQTVAKEISAPRIIQVAITPVRTELFANEKVMLRVLGRYSDKSEKTLSRALQWQISNTSIATITPDGQLSGLRPGRIDVSVRAGDVVSAPVTIVLKDLPKKSQVEPSPAKTNAETKAVLPLPVEPAMPRLAPYLGRAKSLRDQGQYAAALAELQKAAAIDPSNAEVIKEIELTRKACAAELSLGQKTDC